MTLEARIVALAQAIGNDMKANRLAIGDLALLTTTAKTSVVSAINEIVLLLAGAGGAGIDDDATSGDDVTWSVDQILSAITAAKAAVKNELVDGAGSALDTLSELATALGNDPAFATTIATGLANRVRFDAAQTLTTEQKTQARANIGAASAADLGDTDRDLAAAYNTAKT